MARVRQAIRDVIAEDPPMTVRQVFYRLVVAGAVSKNSSMVESNHAVYTASVLIAGHKYWLNGRVKHSKAGKKFLSLSVRPADDRGKPKPETIGAIDV
jgi:hypothetical protein